MPNVIAAIAAVKYDKHLDFNTARDDRVAVASAGPYTNHMHLVPDR